MKKKLFAVLISMSLVICSLTACGGEEETKAAEPVVEQIEETATEAADACSDETFADLQTMYSSISEMYEMIGNYYLENDNIEKNEDVEETLNLAKEYIDQVGEINQEDITEADAMELASSMVDVLDGLKMTAEGLDLLAEAGAAANAGCSDETFAALQEAYVAIVELNGAVSDYYLNTDSVAQDSDIEGVLNQAAEYIDIAGQIKQEDITEADAEELAGSMSDIVDALTIVAEAMGVN